jgi:SAM-dependent methyltransferase
MRTLASFSNLHLGETIVVCGCGQSLNDLEQPELFTTIGVNDVGRRFHPDYLVVVNPPDQFSGDRFRYVESSAAKFLFTQLDLGLSRANVIKFSLGTQGGTDWSKPDVLHYTQNSPYVALCLALHMGAKRIGLIGVDFTEHHFFARTGAHSLTPQFQIIDEQYTRLYEAIKARGLEVFNLSRTSRLTAFPKTTLEQFAAQRRQTVELRGVNPASEKVIAGLSAETNSALQIVSYATTPLAGVPAILACCINARTPHRARCVWADRSYGNGVVFAGDIEWTTAPREAEAALQAADVVIVHNGKVDAQHRALLAGKAIVTMAHNYGWNVDQSFVEQGFPGVVVGQYQATLPEFRGWDVVPNPMPLWEDAYMPEPKGATVTICYTPLGKHESYPVGHKLYWHAKGYETTMRVLERLASRFSIKLEVIGIGQVSHAASLAMKRRSHILIDECATGSYHRNSLEGLAAGCVVVNGVGLLPGVEDVFRRCARAAESVPFVHASLDGMEAVLTALIERGSEALVVDGTANRGWLETHWDFAWQWDQFWWPVLGRSLGCTERKPSGVQVCHESRQTTTPNVNRGVEMISSKTGVSVIIPHGGRKRLPHLTATLANLRQCQGVSEVIVVEMDQAPFAADVARRWADKYVFIRNAGPFHKGRAMNTGIPFAEYDLLLWKDNDVIVPPTFISTAEAESRARKLDYLVPYHCVHYLSPTDSEDVMRGTRNPADCRGTIDYYSANGIRGAMVMVRKAFVLEHGGMPEEFRGWGGEDDAWSCKADLLGRAALTQHQEQNLYHVFHEYSGGYGGADHIKNNPCYAQNIALLNSIREIRDRQELAQRFPAPEYFPCPWTKDRRVVFISNDPKGSDVARQVTQALADLYAVTVDQVDAPGDDILEQWSAQPPDSIVCFDITLALRILSSDSFKALWARTIVVHESGSDLNKEEIRNLGRAGALLTADTKSERRLRKQTGLRPWKWIAPDADREGTKAINSALSLIQPLSLVLGGGERNRTLDLAETGTRDNAASTISLPVWMYWEGECPDWIKSCQRTVSAHARDVRLLNPADFNQVRDVDRDIDLTRLHPAHRADFIRAFLLMKYGGFWIDSDCLVMRSLQPVLDLLNKYDFVGHKERQSYVSNGFIGARPGSKIASALYQRICSILRSGRPLEWTTIGNEPLTEIISESEVAWYEIECELIQPICWSNPDAFFAVNEAAVHERAFDERAICYMLSNVNVQRFQAAHPVQNLLSEDSFFSYVLKKALGESELKPTAQKPRTRNWQHIPFCMDAVVGVDPEKVLDVGIGFGRWGMLLREFCEAGKNGDLSGRRRMQVVGVETLQKKVAEPARCFYDQIHLGDGVEVIERLEDKWDLIIFDEVLQLWPGKAVDKTLRKALNVADYVLVSSSFLTGNSGDESRRQNGHAQLRTLSDYLELNPLRYEVHKEHENVDHGAFLFSRTDPRGLQEFRSMEPVFSKIFQNSSWGDESVSGTGSCLAQTVEIRRSLPLVVADLNIKSMLDVPCGDLNWMKHVRLEIEEYIGADIVPQLIERNQLSFTGSDRHFLNLDVTGDYLPQVDLILCRDCLVHFPLDEITRTLKNFKRSRSKYLLTTTFTEPRPNTEIATGEWRPLNLQLPPFNLPVPVRLINEKCTEVNGAYADKCLGLWRIENIHL